MAISGDREEANVSPGTGGMVVTFRTGLSFDQTPNSVGEPSVNPSPWNVTHVKALYRPANASATLVIV
jgi:hypothetical protein